MLSNPHRSGMGSMHVEPDQPPTFALENRVEELVHYAAFKDAMHAAILRRRNLWPAFVPTAGTSLTCMATWQNSVWMRSRNAIREVPILWSDYCKARLMFREVATTEPRQPAAAVLSEVRFWTTSTTTVWDSASYVHSFTSIPEPAPGSRTQANIDPSYRN